MTAGGQVTDLIMGDGAGGSAAPAGIGGGPLPIQATGLVESKSGGRGAGR